MQNQSTRRRPYGTGSLRARQNADGSRTWVAEWRDPAGQRHKRALGRIRTATRDGLTQKQAEAELRELIGEPPATRRTTGERPSVEQVATAYLAAARRRGRKESTRQNIESEVRVHIAPFFGARPLDVITAHDVEDFVTVLESKGLAPKTIRNIVATLSALFTFAKAPKRRWAAVNPCDGVEMPAVPDATEIRFLTLPEVRLAIEHAPAGMFQQLDKAVWLTAAMTGLRKGELVALRWRDIDWSASRMRVRQNFVRGQFGSPKSKRSTRSVPMADAVGGELDRLSRSSQFTGPDDLVFAHPVTGGPLAKANMSRRFARALKTAELEEHRFHDLRHTFGTRMAAVGTPLRTLQEWMGHRDIATTQRYADYMPGAGEADLIAAAFVERGDNVATIPADLSRPYSPQTPEN
jgi:integrase